MKKTTTKSALASAVTVVAILGMMPTAAQAATQKIETRGGGLIGCLSSVSGSPTVSSANCSKAKTNMLRTYRKKNNGHSVISIKFLQSGKCVDSAAQKSGTVKVHACNSGDYQYLEVFDGSVKGTKVLKSLGAWRHQGVHICMVINGDAGVPSSWRTCNLKDGQQQFRFK